MKKIIAAVIAALLIVTLIFTLAGCKSSETAASADDKSAETAADTATTAAAEQTDISAEDVVFTTNGVQVALNAEADPVIAALGAPNSVESQLSCHGVGDDKTYTYNGFIVNTYPYDEKDMILEVVINGEGIETSKGIKLGDTVDQVKAAYGDSFKEIGMYYKYNAGGGKSLQFFIENGIVQEIDYYYEVKMN